MNTVAKKSNLIVLVSTSLIAILTICVIVFNFIYEKPSVEKLNNSNIEYLNDVWTMGDGKQITAPYIHKTKLNEVFSFSRVLPEYITDDYAIVFKSEYDINHVYVDGELIYSYGEKRELPFGDIIRNVYLVVPLKAEYAGKTITIEVMATYPGAYEFSNVHIGNRDSVIMHQIKKYIWFAGLCLLYLMIALFVLLLAGYSVSVKMKAHAKLLLNCCLYNICMFCRVLLSSSLIQFLTNRQVLAGFVYLLHISVVTAIISDWNGFIFEEKKKIFSILTSITYVFMFIYCVIFVAEGTNIIYILTPYLYGIIIYSIFLSIKQRKKNKIVKIHLFNNLVFIAFNIIGVVELAISPRQSTGAIITLIGYMIYGMGSIYIVEKKHVEVVEKITQNKLYKEVAQRDALTGLGNRMALHEEEDMLRKLKNHNNYITFVMCDLNFLKKTNDELGHDEGDKLIITAARVLEKATMGYGKCFRLGGDEFGILIMSRQNIERVFIEKLLAAIRNNNEKNDKKISISIGFKTKKNDGTEEFFKQLYIDADNKMYEDKRRNHTRILAE